MAGKSETMKNAQANESLRQNLTKEMFVELEETFKMVADSTGKMPLNKLGLALKAIGMSFNETPEDFSKYQSEGIDMDKFIQVTLDCMKHPNWAANEMSESFSLFDKDGNGFVDPSELRRVFARVGENLTEVELEDQLREFDIDGDLQVMLQYNLICIC
jgi:calmodulin